jgi:aquaporin Z
LLWPEGEFSAQCRSIFAISDAMKKYLVELIGTFFLVLTVCTSVAFGAALAPVAIGFALMIMVYAGGHVSGGHYNPAVTLAVTLRGRCGWSELPFYWVAQIAGALLAAWAACGVGASPPTASAARPGFVPLFLAEFLFTVALAYVVLNTATAKATQGNSYFGLAIGSTVLVGAVAVGGVSGAAFNPAVFVGAATFGFVKFSAIVIYVGAQLIGGVVAAFLFMMINPEDK